MIPFTGVGLYGGYRGDDWYRNRIEIFKKYTLKSLLNQEEPNFILWISFRPQEKENPLTAELANYLKATGIEYILTFDGLMYHDDKYTKELMPKVMNYGRIVRGCWRNKTWHDLWPAMRELYQDKNATLETRLSRALEVLRKHFGGVDWVYVTRIDSDDMLHQRAIKEIQAQPPFEGAYVFRNGYIHNADTGRIAAYHPDTNPPFHTIIFKGETFFDARKHKEYFGDFKSHEDVPSVFPSMRLKDGRYCVLAHNPRNHISTIWNHPFRGDVVTDGKEIMREFGVEL